MATYQEILENNQRWVAEKIAHNHNYFIDMAKDQRPD